MSSSSSSCFLADMVPARATLGVMAFLMFLVTQMLRVNVYIAVVAMNEQLTTGNETDPVTENASGWNDNKFSLFMGAFYWSYWATELPGGLLAQRFGGKKVLGICVTLAALVNLILPTACNYHYLFAAVVRALQGLALGVTWPVMHWLSARWIPQIERSKFMTSYHGAAIGTALTYPLSGLIITAYGWECVFYFIGVITLFWCVAWWIFVFDSPDDHPRLSEKEGRYLRETIGDTVKSNKVSWVKTPWKEIFLSKSFWAVLMASQGLMWGSITLSMQTPTYFHDVHHLNVKKTGLLSGIPEVSKFLFALVFSSVIDKAIANKNLTVTSARKLAVVVSEFIPANLLILLGYFGYSDKIVATVLLSATSLFGGASTSGSLANIVDISPNHAAVLLGIIKTLTVIPGVISPLMVTRLTMNPDEDSASQWKNVFLVLSVIYTFCCGLYVAFGSGKVQPWNEISEKSREEANFLERGPSGGPAKSKGNHGNNDDEHVEILKNGKGET